MVELKYSHSHLNMQHSPPRKLKNSLVDSVSSHAVALWEGPQGTPQSLGQFCLGPYMPGGATVYYPIRNREGALQSRTVPYQGALVHYPIRNREGARQSRTVPYQGALQSTTLLGTVRGRDSLGPFHIRGRYSLLPY